MESIAIKKLESVDTLKQLISVFSAAFESEYTVDETYLMEMLKNESATILGAMKEDMVVGGLVAFEMTPIHGTKEFYIYDIGVHPKHQKQGIGKKLIERLKEEAKIRGIKTIFVEAESGDEGAVAFYRAIGGEEVAVNHFNFHLN